MNKDQYYADVLSDMTRALQGATSIIQDLTNHLAETQKQLGSIKSVRHAVNYGEGAETFAGLSRNEINELKKSDIRLRTQIDEMRKTNADLADRLNTLQTENGRLKIENHNYRETMARIEESGDGENSGLVPSSTSGDEVAVTIGVLRQERDQMREERDRLNVEANNHARKVMAYREACKRVLDEQETFDRTGEPDPLEAAVRALFPLVYPEGEPEGPAQQPEGSADKPKAD